MYSQAAGLGCLVAAEVAGMLNAEMLAVNMQFQVTPGGRLVGTGWTLEGQSLMYGPCVPGETAFVGEALITLVAVNPLPFMFYLWGSYIKNLLHFGKGCVVTVYVH